MKDERGSPRRGRTRSKPGARINFNEYKRQGSLEEMDRRLSITSVGSTVCWVSVTPVLSLVSSFPSPRFRLKNGLFDEAKSSSSWKVSLFSFTFASNIDCSSATKKSFIRSTLCFSVSMSVVFGFSLFCSLFTPIFLHLKPKSFISHIFLVEFKVQTCLPLSVVFVSWS